MRAVSSDGLDLDERLKRMKQWRRFSTRLMFFLKLNNLHRHQKVVINSEISPSGNEPQSPSDRLVSTSGPSVRSASAARPRQRHTALQKASPPLPAASR